MGKRHDYLFLDYRVDITNVKHTITYRKVDKGKIGAFDSSTIDILNRIQTFDFYNPNIFVSTLTDNLIQILDKFDPLTTYNAKHVTKKWINSDVRTLMKEGDKSYKLWTKLMISTSGPNIDY